jgi:hypothetical protein
VRLTTTSTSTHPRRSLPSHSTSTCSFAGDGRARIARISPASSCPRIGNVEDVGLSNSRQSCLTRLLSRQFGYPAVAEHTIGDIEVENSPCATTDRGPTMTMAGLSWWGATATRRISAIFTRRAGGDDPRRHRPRLRTEPVDRLHRSPPQQAVLGIGSPKRTQEFRKRAAVAYCPSERSHSEHP